MEHIRKYFSVQFFGLTTNEIDYFPLDLQVAPWTPISTQQAFVETLRVLEGPFSTQIDEGDLKRATQLVIAVLKSLELQESGVVRKETKSKVETPS